MGTQPARDSSPRFHRHIGDRATGYVHDILCGGSGCVRSLPESLAWRGDLDTLDEAQSAGLMLCPVCLRLRR